MSGIVKRVNGRGILMLFTMLPLCGIGAILAFAYSQNWPGPPGLNITYKVYRPFGTYRMLNGDTFTISQYKYDYGGYMGHYVYEYHSIPVSIVDSIHDPRVFCMIPVGHGEYWTYDTDKNGTGKFTHQRCWGDLRHYTEDWNVPPEKIKGLVQALGQ